MEASIAARLSCEFRSIIDEYDLGQFCTSIGVETVSPSSKRCLDPGPGEGHIQAKVHRCVPSDNEGIHIEPEQSMPTTRPVVKASERASVTKQKGLRHFSLIVCEKLRQLRSTTYHSVSDELVSELTQVNGPAFVGANGKKYEAKNIRRRVYDALNVLLAIGVIRKDRKQITWVGLSSAEPLLDRQRQISERNTALQNIELKRQRLSILMRHYIAHHNINERNRIAHRTGKPVEERLYFPFALIQAPRDAIVEVEMKDERRKIRIIGNKPFSLREDKQLLMKMGCSRISSSDLARLIPKDIVPFYNPNHISQHAVFGAPAPLSTDPALYEDVN